MKSNTHIYRIPWRLMRKKWRHSLLMFSVVICYTLFSAFSYGQRITFTYKNVSLEQVLNHIKKSTGYDFLYNSKLIPNNKRITLSVKDADLESVLDQCLAPFHLSYEIQDKTVLIRPAAKQASANQPSIMTAQTQQSVQGTVRDALGQPIQNVTVRIKGTSIQTKTDQQGNFHLTFPAGGGSTVEFTSIGFATQERPVSTAAMQIILEAATDEIDEVVVVGYGAQKKIHVTGSVAQINQEELTRAPMTNVSNMLTGKLPGLISRQTSGLPGSDQANMTIRGFGTFNDSSPLLLVDGVERPFNNIDPSDIESVTILKDAAAAAVYGVKAAHGVILVKTKRGSANDDVTIRYNNSFSFSNNTRFPEFLNGVDYAKWHNRARELDGSNGYFSDEDIEKIKNGDPDGKLGNTDWLGLLFKDYGLNKQHNISAYGGNQKTQYYISAGLMDQDGIVPNASFKRYNVRSNVDVNIRNEVKLAINVAGRKEDIAHPGFAIAPNNGYNPITQAIRALPIIPDTYNDIPTATGSSASTWNPIMAANESGFNKNNRYVFESSLDLSYEIPYIDGLRASIFGNYDHNFTENRNFLQSYYLNKYNVATGQYVRARADGTSELSSLFQGSSNGALMTVRPTLQYDTKINNHSIGALFLYEYRQTRGSSFQASRRDFLINDIPELSFAQEDVANSIRGSSTQTKIAGYVGRFNYGYADKYLAEFSFRYDGSYKFHTDHRWGFFPSLSLGWVLSKENFFQSDKVDYLKLRMSAGELGKDNLEAFLYKSFFAFTTTPVYAFGTSPLANYALYATNSVPSFDLTWEKTRVINAGAEATLFNGKLNAEFDVFYKYTYDILQGIAGVYPPSISNNYRTLENSGEVSARGFELALTHSNRINDFGYSIKGNLSWARNKVLKRTQSENVPSWQNIIGQPLGGVYGFEALGLYQTQEQIDNRPTGPGGVQRLGDLMYNDYNGDGKIDTYDQVRIARSATPELMFALAPDFSWKNFHFGFQLQGAAISNVLISGLYPNGTMDQTEFARAFYGGGNAPYYLVEGSWTPENTNAKYPRLGEAWNGNNGWTSSWWVYNGAYLRLRQAYLAYSLPKQVIEKLRFKEVKLSVSGNNLFTFDYLKYMDPEMPSNNNGYYPQQRTINFGIDVSF